jgi:hypothetical protein
LDFLKRFVPDLVKSWIISGKNNRWKRQPKRKTIIVIFRYDDYSALSRTDLELSIIEVCRKNGIAMTFSVVPFVVEGDVHDPSPRMIIPLSTEKVKILNDGFAEGVLDIALHGYSHQTNNAGQFSEFTGLDYGTQVEKLTKGRQFLANLLKAPVDIFVPPWNAYDLNTLQALKALRFSTISADRTGVAEKNSKLKFLPCTCSMRRLKESAIQSARNILELQPVIVVLFHDFEFLDIDANRGMLTLQEFADLVRWLKSQEDVRILSISQASKVIKDLSARRLQMANPTSAMYRKQTT